MVDREPFEAAAEGDESGGAEPSAVRRVLERVTRNSGQERPSRVAAREARSEERGHGGEWEASQLEAKEDAKGEREDSILGRATGGRLAALGGRQ